ncbi:MAG: ATP-binding protein [Acidimicrobiaceae bacterium]|nr:ATP-binding protein [Acidimicrobiaceae bacterium]MXZ67280.1 ATP-binding protein [Acidimicrobiaceae bacterium]MYF32595.1 ATP-binding protein [Acidimicrobiaceae bacterium]MYG78664.1 ATP-binding protein [Acidimicrobiaceae bacterium]MYJ84987.1 ATP-binding protein [Acidimicrobiaceae bacterium]
MVMANTERTAKALDLLRDGLSPACEATWRGFYGNGWLQQVNSRLHSPDREPSVGDSAFLFKGIKATWNEVFSHGFGPSVRSLVFEVSDVRNRWAHQQSLTSDDTVRALDSMERVLEAFGNSDQRDQIRTLRRDLMRQMFDEESRSERRRTAAKPTEGTPQAGLTPWRDIIAPHADVAAGRFEQAEYAADLEQVVNGRAEHEYRDPQAFFARTYITQGLRDLLADAARRLSGQGGDPVIELQTNFGGGKTHSLIALYHLASGVDPAKLTGLAEILAEEGVTPPEGVNRAVLVGQMISASAPKSVGGGIRLHTMWGHLAYQLGGKEGYDIVRADDLAGTSPGAALMTLFERFGPAVVLIDEWVAYARQLRDGSDDDGPGGVRPAGGDFDTQFTFAQALTEAAAAVPNVMVLISIPASDVEVGGPKGRTALEKLKNVVARKAAQWQPASPDESFEIVRRRLFDPIPADKARVRDGVIRAFCDMYRDQGDKFPAGVGEGEYRRRMELCYPIHPELFDRLFDDWSALDKFQRTRGVLRLMALAISQLWQRDDRSLLIMPGNLPMDYGLLVSEMKKYLEDGWDPVIKADVDGANSLPLRIDQNNSHFGRLSATRRAARAVYMGSAPRPDGRRGVDLKSVVLGCAQPGESPGQFADALRRLSGEATHLYVDGAQYWYSLIPNVTRIAADRAGSNYDDRDADDEVRRRIGNQRDRGAFAAVQVFAEGPGDVPDNDDGVRLVILEPGATHSPNDANSPAVALAERILAQRDAGPRVNPNLVVFLAAAANRLAELRAATRMYLAWKSIVGDQSMNLTAHQQRQADSKLQETSKQVDSLVAETFTLAITPIKQPGQRDVEWQTTRVTAAGDLAKRTSAKLSSEEKLIGTYSGVRIRMDLDRRELWSERGDIAVHKLWETYARFPYMPRLANRDVLYSAIANRATTLTWQQETFAYAEAHDGERWVGLHTDDAIPPAPSGLLIHPDQVPAAPEVAESDGDSADSPDDPGEPADLDGPPPKSKPEPPRRTQFYAQFNLDPVRCIKQLGDIADHVTSKLGDNVELILEVRAKSEEGFDEATHRTVFENAKALGAKSTEFE